MKSFYVQENIGKVRYVVNFHDGIQQHKDGSRFFDIRTFKNKKAMGAFLNSLNKDGYINNRH